MRRLGLLAGALYAVALAVIVFTPISGALNRLTIRLYVLWTYRLDLPGNPLPDDFGNALNVILFVPLGALVVLLVSWPWWGATIAAVAVSVTVELVQVIPLLDRVASLTDMITNSVGGFLGAMLGTWLLAHEGPTSPRAEP